MSNVTAVQHACTMLYKYKAKRTKHLNHLMKQDIQDGGVQNHRETLTKSHHKNILTTPVNKPHPTTSSP